MALPPYQYNPNEIGFGVGYSNSAQYGGAGNVNRQFFNDGGTNWKDSTKFAYEQLAQREANAFNVAMMNYQNQYNSPLEQMKRYQEAGINPYQQGAIQSVQSQSPAGSGAARGTSSAAQAAAGKLNAISNFVGEAFNIVSGIAGIKKQVQQMKYNEEAFPIMINRLRYQTENENLKGFLSELGLNQGTLNLVSLAYDLGVPIDEIPWMTYGPQVKGTSFGFDHGFTSKWFDKIREAPHGKLISSTLGLRNAEKLNKAVERLNTVADTMYINQKRRTEKENTRRMGAQADISEWTADALDITGNATFDKILVFLLQSMIK